MVFFFRQLHMVVPVVTDHQEHTYNSSVQTQNVIWKNHREWWMLGMNGKRGSQVNPGKQRNLMMMMMMIVDTYQIFELESMYPIVI